MRVAAVDVVDIMDDFGLQTYRRSKVDKNTLSDKELEHTNYPVPTCCLSQHFYSFSLNFRSPC